MQALRGIFDAVPVAIVILDPTSGKLRDFNARFCELLGYDSVELSNVDLSQLAADESHQLATPERLCQASEKGPIQFEWTAETASGTDLQLGVSLSTTTLDSESVAVAALEQCPVRRQRETELAAARDRYEMLFENNPIVIWEHDLSAAKAYVDDLAATVDDLGAYLDANPGELEAIMGRVEIIDVNENAVDYYNADDKAQVLNNLDQVMGEGAWELTKDLWCTVAAGETRFRGETVAQTFDGERRHQILELHVPDAHADDYSRAYITGTDITERKRREHELQAIHGAREALQDSLVDSTSLETFAEAACSELTAMNGIAFTRVMIVGPGDTTDTLAASGDDSEGLVDPATLADASKGTRRQVTADATGISEVFVEPITQEGVTRGVLVVGLDTQRLLGADRLAELIAESADVLGYAMGAAARRRALAADEQSELVVTVDAETPISRAVAVGAPSASVRATVPRDEDSVLCYVTVAAADAESLAAAARDTAGIAHVECINGDDPVRLQMISAGPTPSTVVAEHGGMVVDARIKDSKTTLTVRVPSRQTFHPILEAIRTQFTEPRVSEITTTPTSTAETDPLSGLTDRQRDILQTARNAGYFEQPRAQSATEVAERLGVSRQAFAQVLRAAQRNLLANVFEE